MTPHLLAVEVGPVGEFLSAARKTRDLWYGSGLFSAVARAVAGAVVQAAGADQLIFPAPEDFADPTATIADEVWAELPAGVDPRVVAAAAKQAATAEWVRQANAVKDEKGFAAVIRRKMWDEQTAPETSPQFAGDVIECYAAWAPLPAPTGYQERRKLVKRLLGGRTACRNFPQASGSDLRLPKSSLDGARPTVLEEVTRDETVRRLRLTQGEQLDAPGLVKRHGKTQAYPSVARIAADPWLRSAATNAGPEFGAFVAACRRLVEDFDLVELRRTAYPQFADFPFEGALVYETRHAEFAEELAEYKNPTDVGQRREAVRAFLAGPMKPVRDALARLKKQVGYSQPYYAILAADGDRVGEALNLIESAAGHREFSRQLAAFTGRVRDFVAEHSGATVYAGGDDVLAFLPLDTVARCGAKLREAFADVRSGVSLSAGVAIAHFLEPLEDVLQSARDALDDAKGGDKSALAIRYQPRGGAPITVRRMWGDGIVDHLHGYAAALNDGSLPGKAAYDLRTLARDYDDRKVWPPGDATGDVIRADARRLLSRKAGKAGEILGPLLGGVRSAADLTDRANLVLVARRIAAALPAPRGGDG